jgi:hypothetical protein
MFCGALKGTTITYFAFDMITSEGLSEMMGEGFLRHCMHSTYGCSGVRR